MVEVQSMRKGRASPCLSLQPQIRWLCPRASWPVFLSAGASSVELTALHRLWHRDRAQPIWTSLSQHKTELYREILTVECGHSEELRR